MEGQRTAEYLSLKFPQDLQSMSETVKRLIRFLPNWISSRSNAIETILSKTSPSSILSLSSKVETVRQLGQAAQETLACSGKFGYAAGFVGSTITLGMYKGCKTGVDNFNVRRLNSVAFELAKDEPETKYLEELVSDLSKYLAVVVSDVEQLTRSLTSSNDLSRSAQQEIDSTLNESRDGYDSFLKWSRELQNLLKEFFAILGQSREPNCQVSDLLRRCPKSEVVLNERELHGWIETLNKSLAAVKNAKIGARRNDHSAERSRAMVPTNVFPSNFLNAPSSSTNNAYDAHDEECRIARAGLDDCSDKTHEIDQWFSQISRLYTDSIEIAKEVLCLLSEHKQVIQFRQLGE